MVTSHDKVNKLEGGWYAVFENGEVITENDMAWIKVPNKHNICVMGLKWRNKLYEIEGKYNYIPPGERHMRELTISRGSEVQVTKETRVGRFIGYYEPDGKMITRLDITTGKFITEKEPY